MPECPCCDSNNVIRTDSVELDYQCLDCRYDWVDYLEADWYDGNSDLDVEEDTRESVTV